MDVSAHREVCLRCRRPARLCYCEHIPTLTTETRVILLQHPREAKMPIGTARMAHLALPTSELHKGVYFQTNERVMSLLEEPGTALLFPGEGAIDPEHVAPGQIRNLIVVDGTWSQARTVLKRNPMLMKLPRLGLKPEKPGNYRIRKEPSPECLATIEAVSGVLGVLEKNPDRFEAMLAAFTYMVDQQIAHAAARTGPPRAKLPRVREPSDADRIRTGRAHVVLLHVEVNAYALDTNVPGIPELIHFVARRTTGETFEATLLPRRELAPNAPRYLEVAPERFLSGEAIEGVRERWNQFLRSDDMIAGWGSFTREVMTREELALPHYVDLRWVVARHFQTSPGAPSDAARRLGGRVPAVFASGRAGRVVGELDLIAASLAGG